MTNSYIFISNGMIISNKYIYFIINDSNNYRIIVIIIDGNNIENNINVNYFNTIINININIYCIIINKIIIINNVNYN